jgi:dihydropteroate synthase
MFTLNCKGTLLVVDKPLVMGIINTTPDSFYPGSRYEGVGTVLQQAEQMLKDGATILDIGGQSTRPGSKKVSADEELKRVIAPIEAIQKNFPDAFISIDSYYSDVVAEAVAAGAVIINDISAGSIDSKMIETVAALKVPYILMHMQGTPQTMHQQTEYENVTKEVLDFLIKKVSDIRIAGITDIIIDPGLGFGKTISHNFRLLHDLSVFKILECPILLGISRKSTIYKSLGITSEEALNGTSVLHTIGLLNGASILRVHDVKEAIETIKLVEFYKNSGK